MNPTNAQVDLSSLPSLFPLDPFDELTFCAAPLHLLPEPSHLLQSPSHEKPTTPPKDSTASPTGIQEAPQIFPSLNLGSHIASVGSPSLSSLLNNQNFKTSLKSVLSRPPTTIARNSLARKHPDRNCDKPQPSHRTQNATTQTQRRSAQHLRPHKTAPRKHRPASCSKLPRRRSQDLTKRPCQLADEAIACGSPLTKEEARAIRNREHARASRLRAKQKRQSLVADNMELRQRVESLEKEQIRLRQERDSLRLLRGVHPKSG